MKEKNERHGLADVLTNRRHARVAHDVRLLTRGDHWTREIAQLRHQQQLTRVPQPGDRP